jgi:hypothetical protein
MVVVAKVDDPALLNDNRMEVKHNALEVKVGDSVDVEEAAMNSVSEMELNTNKDNTEDVEDEEDEQYDDDGVCWKAVNAVPICGGFCARTANPEETCLRRFSNETTPPQVCFHFLLFSPFDDPL